MDCPSFDSFHLTFLRMILSLHPLSPQVKRNILCKEHEFWPQWRTYKNVCERFRQGHDLRWIASPGPLDGWRGNAGGDAALEEGTGAWWDGLQRLGVDLDLWNLPPYIQQDGNVHIIYLLTNILNTPDIQQDGNVHIIYLLTNILNTPYIQQYGNVHIIYLLTNILNTPYIQQYGNVHIIYLLTNILNTPYIQQDGKVHIIYLLTNILNTPYIHQDGKVHIIYLLTNILNTPYIHFITSIWPCLLLRR